jgi:glycosyltransferase involved in cell wall biosynthesis
LQAARFCDTWVLCDETRYGPPVRRYLEEHGPVPGLHFEFVVRTPWVQRLTRIPGLWPVAYRLWQQQAYRQAKSLHAQVSFDLAHQVTFCSFREPGYLWQLDMPFIWGPLGGTQNYPWRFLAAAGLWGAGHEGFRNVGNTLQLRFSPRVHRALHRAAVVLAANATIQRHLAAASGRMPQVMTELGLVRIANDVPPRHDSARPFRILWSGDLQAWKALQLLLQALAKLPPDVNFEVRILGAGPLKASWQRLARRLGIAEHLYWLGWLPHAEALAMYAWADLLTFTSLRDTTGTVVAEALAMAVPVLCLDHQGVRDLVTPECGIKVPVTTPARVVGRLAEAIVFLARQPAEHQRLREGAWRRAHDYLWSRQGERMKAIYQQVLPEPLDWTEREPPARQLDCDRTPATAPKESA